MNICVKIVRFEVLMAVIIKITVFLYVMQYSLEDIYQRFGGTSTTLKMETTGFSKIQCNFDNPE
jgi:hypothetical protein